MHTDLKTHPIILGTLLLIFLTAPVSGTVITSPGTADLTITSSDWPWWRGIHRNGHAAEQSIPTQWSETESIIWKAPIPGRGHGSPTVIGEQIFLATADEQNQTQSVIGFDRKTGERAWKFTKGAGKVVFTTEIHKHPARLRAMAKSYLLHSCTMQKFGSAHSI